MISTTVFQTGPARYTQTGQSLPKNLTRTEEEIDMVLALTLWNHAVERLIETGFGLAAGWDPEVFTMQAHAPVTERTYTVDFVNLCGGKISVVGIAIDEDHAVILDSGLDIEQ